MTEPRPAPQEPSDEARSQFSAVLTPHRSLGPKGFMVFMGAISVVSFGTGLMFYLMGAWPVMGFMGLDVLLVYVAFKLNFRALRLYETVDLSGEALTVTRVAPSGKSQSWSFNPYWVRLSLKERVGRTSELTLSSHGKQIVLGSFLSDSEREDFATALKIGLGNARSPNVA
ncbi:MAG: DUF2244 domain-containing protein [Hyphomicrobiaceae bacterium]|jgi:uncharacterized membrane protein|nr:DUF2244 domain-containing protein [Methyloceanibacter sp.]MDX2318433.1 DUF2244 domain-containing protein [Hyphomicrobiaceae bacterium]MDX2450460.1 DUF2244 domain-containing protein [Hyphomicrobiaceae bacterium]